MLHYWLSVWQKAVGDSLDFVQQSKNGILFAVLVLTLTALWLAGKHGWKDAMKHWWRTVGEGVVIALVAWVLVLIIHLPYEPFHLQEDEMARKTNAITDATKLNDVLIGCKSDFQTSQSKVDLLSNQVTSQQGVINGEQSTFNLCVATLAKTSAPEKLRTTIAEAGGLPAARDGFKLQEFLIFSNRAIRAKGQFTCGMKLTDVHVFVAGSHIEAMSYPGPGGIGFFLENQESLIVIDIANPMLTPTSPLVVSFNIPSNGVLHECSFTAD